MKQFFLQQSAFSNRLLCFDEATKNSIGFAKEAVKKPEKLQSFTLQWKIHFLVLIKGFYAVK
ncbi:MAG TPA: hypothetical protein DG942_06065 [Ruminococcaceae bacterium]|nr:hypothetical protein [Oscillospiraceae bacterium]